MFRLETKLDMLALQALRKDFERDSSLRSE
jgi:hypothetical protein